MRRFLAILCTGGLLACAGPALAASSGPSTRTRTLIATGTAAPAASSDVDPVTGACLATAAAGNAWVHQCLSGTCECLDVTPISGSGSIDTGRITISDWFVTVDTGTNPATEPTVDSGPNPKCNLFFGVLTASVASTGETKTINTIGTSCKRVIGVSKKSATGTHKSDLLEGGWGISSTPAPSPAASGSGTLTGQEILSTGAISVKLSGFVTE